MKPQSAQRKTLCTPHFLQVESYILYHEFTMKKGDFSERFDLAGLSNNNKVDVVIVAKERLG
jgi:hypothetical protein